MRATDSLVVPRPRERVSARRAVAAVPQLEITAMAVAAALAVAWALWLPPVRDLAGHLFRTEQYEAAGPHVWNNLWYGGHDTPGYSVLFPPVAALLGIGLTGVVAATSAAGCFAALLHRHAGPAAWPGALWFAAGTATNLFTGRVVFAMGVALGLGACLAAQRGRRGLVTLLGVAAGATSAVAAAFVAMAGIALVIAGGSARRRRLGLELAVAPTLTVLAIGLLFPLEGTADFGPVLLAASVAAGLAVWTAAPRYDRVLRCGALLYVLGCALAFLLSTPLGGTAGRLAALVTGPLVLTLLLARHRAGALPAWSRRPPALAAVAIGLAVAAGWQWGSARLDVRDAIANERTTRAEYFAPLVAEIRRRSAEPVRVEIPFTEMHYEALWVAREIPLARGWLRQVDRAHNPLFYDGRLTGVRYARWLQQNGIGWVALAAGPLDRSAYDETRIIRSRPPYLREVWRSPDWRLFRVMGSPGLISGPGRLVQLDDDGFVLHADRPGRLLVRVHHTHYWRVVEGAACVARAASGWTSVDVRRAGMVRVRARFSASGVLRREPRCANTTGPGGPFRTSAVNPPVGSR
jgi:hypothetical protein